MDYARATHIAVGRNYYGRGYTVAEAKSNLRKQGARLKDGYVVLALPEGARDAFVDDFASVRWEWAEDFAGERGEAEIVERR